MLRWFLVLCMWVILGSPQIADVAHAGPPVGHTCGPGADTSIGNPDAGGGIKYRSFSNNSCISRQHIDKGDCAAQTHPSHLCIAIFTHNGSFTPAGNGIELSMGSHVSNVTVEGSSDGQVVMLNSANSFSIPATTGEATNLTIIYDDTEGGSTTIRKRFSIVKAAGSNSINNFTITNIDNVAPTVAITTDSGGSFNESSPGTFTATVTFNEGVTGFANSELVATNATVSSFVTGTDGDAVYTATITPAGTGNVTLNVAAGVAEDAATNDNTVAPQVTVTQTDNVGPTLALVNIASDNVDPSIAEVGNVITVTITAAEQLSAPPAVMIAGQIATVTGMPPNFIATSNVTAATQGGLATINITGFVDLAGNPGAAVTATTDASSVTIKNTIVGDTQKVIASFMVNRANHILSNQPDLTDYVNGTNVAGGGPLGSLALNGNEGAQTLAFSTSRSKIMTEAGKRIALAFGPTDDELKSKTTDGSTNNNLKENRTGTYDIWTQINGSRSKTNTANSSTWVGYFGAHYFVSNTVLVGGLLQLDSAEETNAIPDSRAKGTGWMIGPYIAGKVTNQNIYYEARASWGRSKNEVSPIGTYTDSFKTERWMLSGKLKGAYQLDDISIEPTVRVSYFEDTQEAYRDSLANIIPEQTITLGELRFGPTISRGIKLENGTMFQPNIGIAGVWNFGMENNTIVQGLTIGRGELRARIDAGFISINTKGWTFSASGYFDGIGVDAFDSYGGKVSIVIPLN